MNPPHDFEKEAREIMDKIPRTGRAINGKFTTRKQIITSAIATALSSLRASWEREKGELQAQIEKGFSCPRCEFYQKESEGLKRVFDAEKQALEERVRELTERIKNYER